MKTKTAKRRKVWVTFDGDDPTWVEASAKMAKVQHLTGEEKPVVFAELRPVGGEEPPADVVKLREQILKGVARALRFRGGGR